METLEALLHGVPRTGREFETRRRVLGLSAAAVARQLGVSAATVTKWERGNQAHPYSKRSRWHSAMQEAVRQRAIAAMMNEEGSSRI